jgi:hypothetical protein
MSLDSRTKTMCGGQRNPSLGQEEIMNKEQRKNGG